MSSHTGLCFIARLPFFSRILYRLPLRDIYNLMSVSTSLRYGVSQTNLHRILAEKDDEPHTGFLKLFIMVQDMEIDRRNPNPYIKLMVNAGYTRDVELIEYAIERYRIVESHKENLEDEMRPLCNAVAASIFIGGFDDSTLNWMDVNGLTESYWCIKTGLDYLFREKSNLISKYYSSAHMYRFVDLVVNKYLGYGPDDQARRQSTVVGILYMLLSFCLGKADLDVAEHIVTKLEIIDPIDEAEKQYVKPFPDILNDIKPFCRMMYMLLLNSDVTTFVKVIEYLRYTFEITHQEYCEICFIAIDVENFAVLEWIDQNWSLGDTLTTRCREINTSFGGQDDYYLFGQVFRKIFFESRGKDKAFKIVCDSLVSQPLSNLFVVYALKSTEKYAKRLRNRHDYRLDYLDWITETIASRLKEMEQNGVSINRNFQESDSENEVSFWSAE